MAVLDILILPTFWHSAVHLYRSAHPAIAVTVHVPRVLVCPRTAQCGSGTLLLHPATRRRHQRGTPTDCKQPLAQLKW